MVMAVSYTVWRTLCRPGSRPASAARVHEESGSVACVSVKQPHPAVQNLTLSAAPRGIPACQPKQWTKAGKCCSACQPAAGTFCTTGARACNGTARPPASGPRLHASTHASTLQARAGLAALDNSEARDCRAAPCRSGESLVIAASRRRFSDGCCATAAHKRLQYPCRRWPAQMFLFPRPPCAARTSSMPRVT